MFQQALTDNANTMLNILNMDLDGINKIDTQIKSGLKRKGNTLVKDRKKLKKNYTKTGKQFKSFGKTFYKMQKRDQYKFESLGDVPSVAKQPKFPKA